MSETTATLRSACDDVAEATDEDAVAGTVPRLVARPASTQETAEVLRATAADGLAVVVRGRGTKLTWGRPPERVDVVLDTSRMDRVLDHAAGDLIVETQAGVRLADVQTAVATGNQRLAVEEVVPGASVGGAIAAATAGPSRVAYGTVRDLLIGVTLVRADGVVAKAGGRVVKNVAGYDLGKLVTGSFGTLAVVTEAVFRLHPLPQARRYVTLVAGTADDAHAAVQRVVHSGVVPAAVEVDWPATEGVPGTVVVALEGIEAGVAGRTSVARDLLGDGATDDASPPAWWGVLPAEPGAVLLKATCALSALPQVLRAGADAGVALRGSGGAGVLHGALPAGTSPQEVAAAVEALRPVCARGGGALIVLDAPAEVHAEVDTWGPVAGLDLMRRVKQQFDPERRLAPGRFVGGI